MRKYRTIWIIMLQWGLLWSLVIGCSLLWNQHLISPRAMMHAYHEASTVLNKDLAFRRWATLHGGVYVRPTETTPPNPYLNLPKRDVVTTDGDRLTLMNPAYMTRQVMEMFGEQYGIKGHITSLHLKNPNNAPDQWERAALEGFERGEATELSASITEDGQPYFRLIRMMLMEKGCLKCHADTKIPVGGVRGGVSVKVPLTVHLADTAKGIRAARLGHAAIWLIGMLGIAIASVLYHRQELKEQKAEEQLRQQEALYASLAESSPAGIFHATPAGETSFINRRLTEIIGMTLEQARGNGWSDFIDPEDREQVIQGWQRFVRYNSPFNMEFRFNHPNGSTVWVYVQAANIYDRQGVVTGIVGTLTDITEKKLVEFRLHETSMFLAESQSIARVAGWKSVPDSDLLEWTDEMYRLLEHPDDEPLSHSRCFSYFDPQDLPSVQKGLEEANRDGTPFRLHCRMTSASGRSFWADFRCVGRLNGPDGPYLAGILQDITEYKRVEELLITAREQAEATSRAKSEFLSLVSHELRTPLNGVMGGIQLLELTELNEEQAGYLKMLREAAENELSLVTDLIDLAELGASRVQVRGQRFLVSDCISQVVEQQREQLEKRPLQLKLNLPQQPDTELIGDRRCLMRILTILLANAIKFTEKGLITITARLEPDYEERCNLMLAVADTGIGIRMEDHERIFEPLIQVDMSNSRRFGGGGIGLAICRRMVDLLGGRLWLESTPGQGSCFYVELPFKRVI